VPSCPCLSEGEPIKGWSWYNGVEEKGCLLLLEVEMSRRLAAIIQPEGTGFVSLCPDLDIASQGNTIEEARDNLREALELFFECASPAEIGQRWTGDVFVTQVEVAG
jgi:predicted RNase H-like HicB family nuclease